MVSEQRSSSEMWCRSRLLIDWTIISQPLGKHGVMYFANGQRGVSGSLQRQRAGAGRLSLHSSERRSGQSREQGFLDLGDRGVRRACGWSTRNSFVLATFLRG